MSRFLQFRIVKSIDLVRIEDVTAHVYIGENVNESIILCGNQRADSDNIPDKARTVHESKFNYSKNSPDNINNNNIKMSMIIIVRDNCGTKETIKAENYFNNKGCKHSTDHVANELEKEVPYEYRKHPNY